MRQHVTVAWACELFTGGGLAADRRGVRTVGALPLGRRREGLANMVTESVTALTVTKDLIILAVNVLAGNVVAVHCPLWAPPLYSVPKSGLVFYVDRVKSAAVRAL